MGREATQFKSGNAGRPRGAKNKTPRSVKRSLAEVLEHIERDHDGDIQAALLAGIRAKPPKSFPYLQLAYHYRVGKPKDTMDVNVTQPVVFECFEPEPTSDGKDEPSTPRSDALAAAGFDEAVLQAIRGTRGEPGVEVSR